MAKRIVATIQIISQKGMKNLDGTCKFMGDRFWKIKIERDMTWEDFVEVVGHELMHYLIESFRKEEYPTVVENGDHDVCVKIANTIRRLIVRRLKETEKHTNLDSRKNI